MVQASKCLRLVSLTPYNVSWDFLFPSTRPSRLSYAAKLVLAAVEGWHVESAVDLLVLKGGFVNPLAYPLYRQATCSGELQAKQNPELFTR